MYLQAQSRSNYLPRLVPEDQKESTCCDKNEHDSPQHLGLVNAANKCAVILYTGCAAKNTYVRRDNESSSRMHTYTPLADGCGCAREISLASAIYNIGSLYNPFSWLGLFPSFISSLAR